QVAVGCDRRGPAGGDHQGHRAEVAVCAGGLGVRRGGPGRGEPVGHGLGLAQYDRPVISRIWSLDYPEEIRPGMGFALGPQHGKGHEFGVRLEEMLLVTDSGHELLSTYASDSIISVG